MKPKRQNVSMKDVAALAGVSIGTVSNVLNSPERVLDSTREKVQGAIEKLGWVRNESARQLRAGTSDSIGMIVLDVANPYFTGLLLGAEETLNEHGYTVYVGNSNQNVTRESRLIAQFIQSRVAGVLMIPSGPAVASATELQNAGVPAVFLDRGADADFCSVGMDDIEGGRLAVQHLINRGHSRLAFVAGPTTLPQVRDRLRGARLAVPPGSGVDLLVLERADLNVEEGKTAAAQIVRTPPKDRPTAVFAANDLIAIGLLQVFVAEGLAVPQDIAIIGYDDIEFAASAAVPLSSIRQPRHEMGKRAAELLMNEIDDLADGKDHEHQAVRFVPELIARVSTSVDS